MDRHGAAQCLEQLAEVAAARDLPKKATHLLAAAANLREAIGIDTFAQRVCETVGREPLVFAQGPAQIQRVAICSGGAASELIRAAHEGYDVFVTGEPGEPALQTARELGIHFVAGGHDATERLGVQALSQRLAERFGLDWEFIPVENPV